MNNLINKFKDTFLTKEFILFVIIGIVNTFNGVLFAAFYSKFLNGNIAFAAGYISGLFISYILNSFVTFKETLSFSKFIKFAVSYIPNFIIQNLAVFLIFNILGWPNIIAYALAAIIGVPITFILMKFFAFSKNKSKK